MATRRPALDPDAPARTEVLHASERTRVARLFLPGRTVIRKEPLGADAPPSGCSTNWRCSSGCAAPDGDRAAGGRARPYAGSIVLVDAGGASAVELPEAVGRR